ncbi:hypothetical protein L208DRAFT_553892 [Tricholoma matsutake]|nr:hypothetical protein L208DRAFT_553892 [Tricholoma matsutake 945]
MTTRMNRDHETATMQHPPLPCSKHKMKGWFSTDVSSPAPQSSLTSPCLRVDLFSCFLICFFLFLFLFLFSISFSFSYTTAASNCSQHVNVISFI